jgi:hypothetical protein
MTLEVPITGRQGVRGHALIDDEDWARVGDLRWCLNTGGYAMRVEYVGVDRRRFTVLMHRLILGLEHGDPRYGDHLNRNRLDNRRENLRILDRRVNAQNHSPNRGSTSRFRGVNLHGCGRWQAQAQVDGVKHYLGLYEYELDAANAAQAFRLAHMPFATD